MFSLMSYTGYRRRVCNKDLTERRRDCRSDATTGPGVSKESTYLRAMAACGEARGYTVRQRPYLGAAAVAAVEAVGATVP
jgi:hypothetical protein